MVEGLDGLPPWLQTTVASAFAIGAALAAFRGYTKKKLDGMTDDHHSSDTVMVSGALADGAAIRELTTAIREMTSAQILHADLLRHIGNGQDTMCRRADDINNCLQFIKDDVMLSRKQTKAGVQ